MPAPSRKDVDLMSNLMKVMNGKTPTKLTETSEQGGTSPVDVTPGVKRSDIDAMSKIMKGFNEAATSVAHKVKNTITESTKTEKGVKVGAFSVYNYTSQFVVLLSILTKANQLILQKLLI